MFRQGVKKALHRLGFELRKTNRRTHKTSLRQPIGDCPALEAIWPLPRRTGGPSDEEIRRHFARFDLWHYAYQFDGGLSFRNRNTDDDPLATADRALQRFRHFMPYLVEATGGSLRGRRILDIACNSGFWSIQCALLGADVVGFDARDDLIEQANLIKGIVGIENVEFRRLDFWNMSPETLGGRFDAVLNLGILYHLPSPLEAIRLALSMAKQCMLLDTEIYPSADPLIRLDWEEPFDIRAANEPSMVERPSRSALDLILRQLGVANSFEIPLHTNDMPRDYLDDIRSTWLIKV